MPRVAVPVIASAYATVTRLPLAALRRTTYVSVEDPPFPSITLGDVIDTIGTASSSAIVPVPLAAPLASLAFVGLLNVTTTVSSGSSSASPVTKTPSVRLVVPAAKVSVPPVSAV